jgi:hypothetical protein
MKIDIDEFVDKEYSGKSSQELVDSPIIALKGVGPKAAEAFKAIGINTIGDFAQITNTKFYSRAALINTLAIASDEKKPD